MRVSGDQVNIIKWLENNVGPLSFTTPTMKWYGQGWCMKIVEEFNPPDNFTKIYYDVDIYDEQKAFIFALKWT
jgi:hypothetical protein